VNPEKNAGSMKSVCMCVFSCTLCYNIL